VPVLYRCAAVEESPEAEGKDDVNDKRLRDVLVPRFL
jgi:hypothetical protein